MDINWEAWGRNALAFISEHDMASEFKEWCGGWPIPETDNAAARAHAAKPDALVGAAREAVTILNAVRPVLSANKAGRICPPQRALEIQSEVLATLTTLRAALGDRND